MPRPRKPARPTWHPTDKEWFIHDGRHRERTGCRDESDVDAAEEALKRYLNRRGPDALPRGVAADGIDIAPILEGYARARVDELTDSGRETLAYRIAALMPFWGNLTPADVTEEQCKQYGRGRAVPRQCRARNGKPGRITGAGPETVRRDLGVLQAALKWAAGAGVITGRRDVKLPRGGRKREGWLTVSAAAWLLFAARGGWDKKNRRRRSAHLQRFILVSLGCGRRETAVLELKWKKGPGGGSVDLRRGVADFKDPELDGSETRRKPRGACALPAKVLGHMRRWRRLDPTDATHVIMHRGKRKGELFAEAIAEIDTAFNGACRRAEKLHAAWVRRTGAKVDPLHLSDISIHSLKRTAITWFFQSGGTLEDAEDFFATSRRTLEQIYKAHSPHHQSRAREVANRRGRDTRAAA